MVAGVGGLDSMLLLIGSFLFVLLFFCCLFCLLTDQKFVIFRFDLFCKPVFPMN